MKTVVFTLCSNNYLAHAKTLGDSIIVKNPDVIFIIGLVDKKSPAIDYSLFSAFEIIEYDEIQCVDFPRMLSSYTIVEFNTAVKPFYIELLWERYGKECFIYYIDPDIVFYSPIEELNAYLNSNDIIITPHLTKALIPLNSVETNLLKTGIFNLGFIGLKYSDNTFEFIKWWQERLKVYCYMDKKETFYVDQIWVNFVPALFDKVFILRDPIYNMAWWNLTERILIEVNEEYYVNNASQKLVFFHFSGYKPGSNKMIGRIDSDDYSFEKRPDLKKIFIEYEESLQKNSLLTLSKIKPLIKFKDKKISSRERIGLSLRYRFDLVLKKVFNI
jgi:hypothetical protein